MSERYQIITIPMMGSNGVKNFKLLEEARKHYEYLKKLHKNDDGFREYDSGKGFVSSEIVSCELVDTECEINYKSLKTLSYEEIYKKYKHGGSLKGIPNEDIFNALKKHKLQVVLVYDNNGFERIYNFVTEKNKFYRIV